MYICRLTGVDENLIIRFHIILQCLSCGLNINFYKFAICKYLLGNTNFIHKMLFYETLIANHVRYQ